MQRYRRVMGMAGGALLAACADTQGPALSVSPSTASSFAVAPDGHEALSYSSESEVPPEYLYARVHGHREHVTWESSQVTGYGAMEYFGNRGRMDLELHILTGYSTVATPRDYREQSDILPLRRVLGQGLPFSVPETCGQTANLTVQYSARTIIFIDSRLTEIGPHIVSGHASGSQPSCPSDPGGSGTCRTDSGENVSSAGPSPDGYMYDPYDPGYETPSGCTGGGSSGETGIGSGSEETFPEMCTSLGGTLYYDYGCFEAFNTETATWETIWCGTIAVCET